MRVKIALRVAAASLMAVACCGAAGAAEAGAALAPHRAIYDLKLLKSHGKRSIEAVRGRILYDFTGSVCEGYALQFRQVSEIDNGEGKKALSDLRAVTWEDGDAKSFRFNSENKVNERVVDTVDGSAGRDSSGVSVKLSKPASKSFDLEANIVFPTEHVRRVIEAAEAGKNLLELSVFDGSESGDKVFSTLAVIGNVIAPGEKLPDDAAAGNATLAALKRWPVTISYFDQAAAKAGEQTPAYAIGFELYENGISRALSLDYGDFVVSGTMSQLELKDAAPCK
jgi:envelope integrity protein B